MYCYRLPAAYYARDFRIGGYLNFGLAVAPDGLIWVRYGPDALLIDESAGEVVYNVFC